MPLKNQILMYQAESGETQIEVFYEGETVWLSQDQMAELFQKAKSTINEHINNIYKEGELSRALTMRKFGNSEFAKPTQYYSLDIIISVGYRVKSRRGTQFRIWATKQLRELLVKGFVMNDDRLAHGGSNYFDELVERVRRIRSSEFNLYKKVRSIFATSIDYDKDSGEAHEFYATVQNKFHYAIHGRTAAELIIERVGGDKLNMGLTNWRNGEFTLQEAFIAKNYLEATEMKRLELLVEQFLSFAELRYLENTPMYMANWVRKLDQFIGELNDKPVLTNAGTVSRQEMEIKVREAYEAYKDRIIAEEALSEYEWDRMLIEATNSMLLPSPDDLEELGLSTEFYNERIARLSRLSDAEHDNSDDF